MFSSKYSFIRRADIGIGIDLNNTTVEHVRTTLHCRSRQMYVLIALSCFSCMKAQE